MQAFNVYQRVNGAMREIDTIFYGDDYKISAGEVRSSLINHDGYDPDIIVRKRIKGYPSIKAVRP